LISAGVWCWRDVLPPLHTHTRPSGMLVSNNAEVLTTTPLLSPPPLRMSDTLGSNGTNAVTTTSSLGTCMQPEWERTDHCWQGGQPTRTGPLIHKCMTFHRSMWNRRTLLGQGPNRQLIRKDQLPNKEQSLTSLCGSGGTVPWLNLLKCTPPLLYLHRIMVPRWREFTLLDITHLVLHQIHINRIMLLKSMFLKTTNIPLEPSPI
jgi:hypothetical protein